MLRRFCRAKIHRATITASRLDYEGSIEIDETLRKAADIAEQNRKCKHRESLIVLVSPRPSGHRQNASSQLRLKRTAELMRPTME